MHRIRVLFWKELIELRQDPRLFSIVVLAPIAGTPSDTRHVPGTMRPGKYDGVA